MRVKDHDTLEYIEPAQSKPTIIKDPVDGFVAIKTSILEEDNACGSNVYDYESSTLLVKLDDKCIIDLEIKNSLFYKVTFDVDYLIFAT